MTLSGCFRKVWAYLNSKTPGSGPASPSDRSRESGGYRHSLIEFSAAVTPASE